MNRSVLKKIPLFLSLLMLLAEPGFTQQRPSVRIIGRIPDPQSAKTYQLQAGAFRNNRNAEAVFDRLRRAGLTPFYEPYRDLTRVMIRGVGAKDVTPYLERIGQAGFPEVIIREDQGVLTGRSDQEVKSQASFFSAKWEITSGNSDFTSFEFDEHGNFLAVKNGDAGAPYLGKYKTVSWNTLELKDYGTLAIQARMNNAVNFTFTAAGSDKAVACRARENTDAIDNSPQTNMLCRLWRSTLVNGRDVRGLDGEHRVFFSKAGTFYVTYLNEDRYVLGQWKWKDRNRREFVYSWDNWETRGTDRILALTDTYWKDEWAVDKYDRPPVWESFSP